MSSKELEFLHEVLPRCVWDKNYASNDICVTLTFAQSLDGKIAGVGGRQLILSGKESMLMTHWMRSMHDAILVGINTVLNDNPQLNTRHLPPKNEPYAQPLPVILDPRLRILDFKDKCKLFANARAGTGRRPLIICARASEEAERSLRSTADMHYVELGDDGRIPLRSLIHAIGTYQIRTIMVEGVCDYHHCALHRWFGWGRSDFWRLRDETTSTHQNGDVRRRHSGSVQAFLTRDHEHLLAFRDSRRLFRRQARETASRTPSGEVNLSDVSGAFGTEAGGRAEDLPMASPAYKAASRLAQIARSIGPSTFTATPPTRYLASASSVAANMSHQTASQRAPPEYYPRPVGPANSLEHRTYLEAAVTQAPVSPWHDIPLFADQNNGILNMIVEIPRWTNAKMEISKEEPFNPIKQDIKKGRLRYVRNCFPHHGYIWNYGAFPQTWEDPNQTHAETKARGDNDPLDVCEIGEQLGYVGQIKQVKVLGIMALLDEGETDWKVIVVDINDPLAPKLNDIEDVERHLPGLIRATNEWFRIYKIPDGKPENAFAFSGEAKNKKYATEIIHECHEAWRRLITGEVPAQTSSYDLSIVNITVQGSPGQVPTDHPLYTNIPKATRDPPKPIDASISKWFFISSAQV